MPSQGWRPNARMDGQTDTGKHTTGLPRCLVGLRTPTQAHVLSSIVEGQRSGQPALDSRPSLMAATC